MVLVLQLGKLNLRQVKELTQECLLEAEPGFATRVFTFLLLYCGRTHCKFFFFFC